MRRIPLAIALQVALGVTPGALYPLGAQAFTDELDPIAQACGAGLAAGMGSATQTGVVKVPVQREINFGVTTPELTLGNDKVKTTVPSFELFRYHRVDSYVGGTYQPQWSETQLFSNTLKYTDAYIPAQGVCVGFGDEAIAGVLKALHGGANDAD